jgi:hypothetical protein
MLFGLNTRQKPAICPKLIRAHPIWPGKKGNSDVENQHVFPGEIRGILFVRLIKQTTVCTEASMSDQEHTQIHFDCADVAAGWLLKLHGGDVLKARAFLNQETGIFADCIEDGAQPK